jgi:hypothetical protein
VPVNSVGQWLVSLLNGIPLPGPAGEAGNLAAYLTPPDPGTLTVPTAYIWPENGQEKRLTPPRVGVQNVAGPGWKCIAHRVALYLTWVGAANDPSADTNFPAVIDAVMSALRISDDQVTITDPVSGALSSVLIGIGEELTYDFSVVHTLADQRYLRYDARLTVTLEEYFNS